jgi:hypothetical protein
MIAGAAKAPAVIERVFMFLGMIILSIQSSYRGLSDETRTRAFPSPTFGGFGFFVVIS